METKTLKNAQIGETLTVIKINGSGILRRRIMDMGITRGVSLHVRKVAPLGDPIQISLRDYELTLRKSEAEQIIVE